MNIFDKWSIVIKEYNKVIESLPASFSGLRILQITDLHSKWFGEGQKDLMEAIDSLDFDIIAVTGDLVNKHNPDTAPGISMFEKLKKYNVPVFFVKGNHECYSGYKMEKYLEDTDVNVLINRSCLLEKDGISFNIMGVDDPHMNYDDLDSAFEEVDSRYTKILLAHAPEIAWRERFKELDVVISGHTHAGQFRIPYIGALYAPGQWIFPKLVQGRYDFGKTSLYVCGGLGESRIGIRLLNKPEIYMITIRGE